MTDLDRAREIRETVVSCRSQLLGVADRCEKLHEVERQQHNHRTLGEGLRDYLRDADRQLAMAEAVTMAILRGAEREVESAALNSQFRQEEMA